MGTRSGTLEGRRIAWGISGGIAAYKACESIRLLVKDGAQVRAAMTSAATRFVGAVTVEALTRAPVLVDLFGPGQGAQYGHLDLARWADLLVLAPATANLIGRVRAGLADDAVTTTVLAARCPVLVAPAMNVAMWESEVVQANVAALRALPRFHLVGPASGELADGDVGPGRLAEPQELLDAVRAVLAAKDLAGRKLVITAGPTREHLDPVRFLSNPSTGRMGYALAAAARDRGAEVTLLSGPTELAPPAGVRFVRVTSADELCDAALSAMAEADAFLAAAAVADQKPASRAPQKAKKQEGPETLVLERTPDVLENVSRAVADRTPRPVLVGFAAETERLVANAKAKLARKRLDLIVANDVGAPGAGFASETNRVVLVAARGAPQALPLLDKRSVAEAILDRLVALLAAREAPAPGRGAGRRRAPRS